MRLLKCFSAMVLVSAHASAQCVNPPNNAALNSNGLPSGWAQSITAQIYINSTLWSAAEITALEQGFLNWQSSDNNANVTYQFTVLAGPPAPTGNYVEVRRETPANPQLAGQISWTSTLSGSINTVANAVMQVNPSVTGSYITQVTAHEVGHLYFLGDCNNCTPGTTIMASPIVAANANTAPTTCDNAVVNSTSSYPPPPPPCGSCVPPPVDGCQSVDTCTCACLNPSASPILLAVGPSADYQLVGPQRGVWFDLDSDGTLERLGWTQPNDWVGFLALDRNHNGIIDNGQELFGNFTLLGNGQRAANGFQALAYWDSPQAGGNGNGWIDPGDAVWANLRVWIDFNHDGISQPNELFTLSQLNISAISTTYSPEMRRDRFGNGFRYRGQFIINGLPRWAYDVYFAVARH